MKIQTRRTGTSLLEVKIVDGSSTIDLGLLDQEDRSVLKAELQEVIHEIDYMDRSAARMESQS